jgi:hypothetical protein
MSDFEKRINRYEEDKNKNWGISPVPGIERDRKEKEEYVPRDRKEEIARNILFATLGYFCKKFITLLTSKEKLQAVLIDLRLIASHLQVFKELLQSLEKEDVSRKTDFIRQFSEIWQKLQEDLETVESFEKDNPKLGPKLNQILRKIGGYPPFVDHPLGYYLAEHAGSEWLPVPFMEILSQLHKEHQQKSEKSELSSWLALLEQAISALDIRADLI